MSCFGKIGIFRTAQPVFWLNLIMKGIYNNRQLTGEGNFVPCATLESKCAPHK